jgi:pimeloyl-ACP methyl ester carboxylesterase
MISVSIPHGRGSRALWSTHPTGTVVVFVHGFNGHATDTWTEFDRLLLGSKHDLVFFGYDSLRGTSNVMALKLLECLEALWDDPTRFVNGTLDPSDYRAPFTVKRLLLVAHSLGAVVSRRALLHACTKKHAWLNQVELCLFAPAHRGAHVTGLVKAAMSLFQAPLEAIAKWRFPILADLEKGSQLLTELAEQTSEAIDKGQPSLRAQLVVLAENDDVVDTNPFCVHDDPGQAFAASHTKVCKPDDAFDQPFKALSKILKGA